MYFPKKFDISRAIELGELIEHAYAHFESFQNGATWEPPPGYTITRELFYQLPAAKSPLKNIKFLNYEFRGILRINKYLASDVPFGYIVKKKNCLYLIFRGTKTVGEWIRDLNIGLVPYVLPEYGKVHEGFLQTYTLFRADIKKSLAEIAGRIQVFVAGHSLGAAVATLAVPDIAATLSRSNITLYTFGSPRIGDSDYAATFNRQFGARSFRIVNTSDLVCSIPLPVQIGYRVGGYFAHVATPVNFTFQANDLEVNHTMKTYLSALRSAMR